MPTKFIRCVKKVKKKSPNVNPYAVCRVSTGYYGTTHNIGLKHKIVKDKNVNNTSKRRFCSNHGIEHRYGNVWEYDKYNPRTQRHDPEVCDDYKKR